MTTTWLLVALLGATPNPPSAPEALFSSARTLMKSLRYAEACPLLEKSHALEPALGTLLNLGDCYEKLGRRAKAFTVFSAAAEWSRRQRDEPRGAEAKARMDALAKGLGFLTVSTLAPVPGLSVSTRDNATPLGALPLLLPVEPGAVVVEARAPGYAAVLRTVVVKAAESAALTLPPLQPLSAPAPSPDAPVAARERGTTQPEPDAPRPSSPPLVPASFDPVAKLEAALPARPTGAIVSLAAGGAALAVGCAGLAHSYSTYGRLQRQQPGQPDFASPTVDEGQLKALRWIYPASWAATAVGAGAMIAGAAWFERASRAGLSLGVAPNGGGVSGGISGRF